MRTIYSSMSSTSTMSRSPFLYDLLPSAQRVKYAELHKLYPSGELLLADTEPVFVWKTPLGFLEYNLATGSTTYSLTTQPLAKMNR